MSTRRNNRQCVSLKNGDKQIGHAMADISRKREPKAKRRAPKKSMHPVPSRAPAVVGFFRESAIIIWKPVCLKSVIVFLYHQGKGLKRRLNPPWKCLRGLRRSA